MSETTFTLTGIGQRAKAQEGRQLKLIEKPHLWQTLSTKWGRERLQTLEANINLENGSRVGRVLSKVSRFAQKISTVEEGRSLFPNSKLRSVAVGTGIGAVAMQGLRLWGELTQTDTNRLIEAGILGAGYLTGATRLKPSNINWEVAAKMTIRGAGLALTTYAVDQAMHHLGVVPQVDSLLGLPLKLSVARLMVGQVANSLGISFSGEYLLNHLFGHQRSIDQLRERLWFNDGKLSEEYSYLPKLMELKEKYFKERVITFSAEEMNELPANLLALTRSLKLAEESLSVQMLFNPTRYLTKQVKRGERVETINNLEVVKKIVELEEFIWKISRSNSVFDKRFKPIISLIEAKNEQKRQLFQRRLLAGVGSIGITTALVGAYHLPVVQELGKKIADIFFGGHHEMITPPQENLYPKNTGELAINDGLQPVSFTRENLPNPANLFGDIMEGKANLGDAVSLLAQKQPLYFIDDKTGAFIGEYNQTLRLNSENFPPDFFRYVEGIEGKEDRPVTEFLRILATRNIEKIVLNKGAYSGGSNPAIQLVELMAGQYNDQPLINPTKVVSLHHPENYNPKYLAQLLTAALRGKIPKELTSDFHAATSTLKNAPILTDDDLPTSKFKSAINKLCAKMESYLAGERLVKNYGADEVNKVYAQNIPLGAVEGMEIYGYDSAALAYFGKPLAELNQGQQIALIGAGQAPSIYLHDSTILAERAKTVLDILVGKHIIKPAEVENIKSQIDYIASRSLTRKIPVSYHNTWLDNSFSEDTQKRVGRLIDAYNLSDRGLDYLPKDAMYSAKAIVVPIESHLSADALARLADPSPFYRIVLHEPTQLPSLEHVFTPVINMPLQEDAKEYIRQKIVKIGDAFYFQTGNQQIKLPTFINGEIKTPGIEVAMANGDGQLLADVDPTEILSKLPILSGSTIKPFVTAFLAYETNIDLEKMLIDNRPGKYVFGTNGLIVSNSSDSLNLNVDANKLSLAQALAYSSNVPFQKLMKEFLASDPKGWEKFQAFLGKFGLTMTDNMGKPLAEPSCYAVIGSDAYVDINQLAIGYAKLANPDKAFAGDQKLIDVAKKVTGILTDVNRKLIPSPTDGSQIYDQNMVKTFVGSDPNKTYGFKTGTVGVIDPKTKIETRTDLVTAGFSRDKISGEVKTVVVHVRGQTPQGSPENLINGWGSTTALPIANNFIDSVKVNPNALVDLDANHVISNIKSVWQTGVATLSNYQVATVKRDTDIFNLNGRPIGIKLSAGQIIDKFSQPVNGYQPVAINLENGKVVVGYVKLDAFNEANHTVMAKMTTISSPLMFGTSQQTSQSTAVFIEKLQQIYQEAVDQLPNGQPVPIKLLIVNNHESSPLMASFYKILSDKKMMAMTVEDAQRVFDQCGFKGEPVIVVNEDLMKLYLEKDQDGLAKVLLHEAEHWRQSQVVQAGGVALDELLWKNGQAQPAQFLVDALSGYRLSLVTNLNNQERLIVDFINGEDADSLGLSRLKEIYDLYFELIRAAEDGRTIDGDKTKIFIDLLSGLNGNPSPEELRVLGIKTG